MANTPTHDAAHAKDETIYERAQHAFEQSRDAARHAASAEANPLGLVVGGLALGALVATIIPRSAKERELLAPLGKRIHDTAAAAIAAGKERGFAELEQRGLTRDGAREQVRSLFEGLAAAATSAGTAATDAARDRAA